MYKERVAGWAERPRVDAGLSRSSRLVTLPNSRRVHVNEACGTRHFVQDGYSHGACRDYLVASAAVSASSEGISCFGSRYVCR